MLKTATSKIGIVTFIIATMAPVMAQAADYSESGTAAFVAIGDMVNIEADHPYFVGKFSGAFVATGEPGRFQHSGLMCLGYNDVPVGAGGFCVYTLGTGDTATVAWDCDTIAPPPGTIMGGDCHINFVSGTGELEGISGTAIYEARLLPPNPDGSISGLAVFTDGFNYSLPD